MLLKLAVAGKVIASVPLNATEATNLEYLYTKKSMLQEASYPIIVSYNEPPVYYIEVASKMNTALS